MVRFPHLFARCLGRLPGIALLVLLGLGWVTPARAVQDVVQFGNSIDVAEGSEIHDAVCFFCSINVRGTSTGNIVAFFGSVEVDGKAQHDVVDFFGEVKAGDNASISHNVVNFFGRVRLGNDASVGKDLVVIFGSLRAAPTASIGGNRVVQPGWLFWIPLLILAALVNLIVRSLRYAGRPFVRGY